MLQHSADGCTLQNDGASDTLWPTLQRGTRFGGHKKAVLGDAVGSATGMRPQGEGGGNDTFKPTLVRGTRCSSDQNAVLGDAAGYPAGVRRPGDGYARDTLMMTLEWGTRFVDDQNRPRSDEGDGCDSRPTARGSCASDAVWSPPMRAEGGSRAMHRAARR